LLTYRGKFAVLVSGSLNMSVLEVLNKAWRRRHDDPSGAAVVGGAPRTVYPQALEDLIEICSSRTGSERFHAAGSHWALSEAAISDNVFVETHDPEDLQVPMGRTLYDVVPGCMNPDFVRELAERVVLPFSPTVIADDQGFYPIHVEAGKRVYQLYAELDAGDSDDWTLAHALMNIGNADYLGPWALRTAGNSGGQTIFGALTTGTHGGDWRIGPIADGVVAMHLVVDGGKHYWIEPESLIPTFQNRMTDADGLRALYGHARYGGANNFAVVRSDEIFDAVLVSAGRFGVVYSVVLAAVRQYCLHQSRRLTTWRAIKDEINTLSPGLFSDRFVQVAVSLTPQENFTGNAAAVTKRWNVTLAPELGSSEPKGRAQRRGPMDVKFEPRIRAPRFRFAGNSPTYVPDPSNATVSSKPDLQSLACANGDYLEGVIKTVASEIDDFVKSNGAVVGAGVAAVTVSGLGGGAALALIPLLAAILPVLLAIISALSAHTTRIGEVLSDVQTALLADPDPAKRAAGLLVWQMISNGTFKSQQADSDYEAISYAVLDGHDYLDRSCNFNIDSIEVFFDATDPMLIAFVDALLAFEVGQEVLHGRAAVGYASLRFTGPTRALLGQQRFATTCAIEVGGMRDVPGTSDLIDYGIGLALNSNFKGILHWGQRNPSTRAHVEERFGDARDARGGALFKWRRALSALTENGRLDRFSNGFTRRTGLEVVDPRIGSFSAAIAQTGSIVFSWDCLANPPGTTLAIAIFSPSNLPAAFPNLDLLGDVLMPPTEQGTYRATLTASLVLNGEERTASQTIAVTVA
jgi:hypothetical protein